MDRPSGISPVDTSEPSAPVDPKSYVIGAEDVLAVVVWHERDVSGAVSVRPDGKITLPLIGELQAAGQTPQELKTMVTEKLSQFLNRPEVMVSVQQVRSKKYYITGQAGRTGAFPLVVPTTVLEALSGAGGFQQWAKTKKIRILRDGGRTTLKFNYNQVINGKNLDQNVYLQNGDNIIVP
jgi:polysaccharide export outer membrane protein